MTRSHTFPFSILALSALLPLQGCGFGLDYLAPAETGVLDTSDADTDADSDTDSDADSDADTDADADADPMRVISVNPEYGTTAGDVAVTIKGGPFDDSVSVRFGGNAATIDSVTSNEIHVHTPSAGTEGAVDVEVATDADSATLTSGFVYVEDATGQTAAIGMIYWYHYVGSMWDPSATDFGSASYFYSAPTSFQAFQSWTSTMDTCTSGYTSSTSLYYYDMGASTASWTGSNGSRVNLGWDSANSQYSNANLTNAQYASNGTYDQDTLSGTAFPAFAMPNIAETPGTFNVTSPAIAGGSAPNVQRSTFTLQWSGGGGDYMVADIQLLDSTGSSVVEEVTCALNDDGSFTIPSGVWRSWATNRYVIITLGRAKLPTGIVPYNNGNSEIAGVYFVSGVARTQ